MAYCLWVIFMSRVKDLRKQRGYTQAEMQALTGIAQSTYSKIEREQRPMSVKQCIQIAQALDTSMDYILGRTDQIAFHPRRR